MRPLRAHNVSSPLWNSLIVIPDSNCGKKEDWVKRIIPALLVSSVVMAYPWMLMFNSFQENHVEAVLSRLLSCWISWWEFHKLYTIHYASLLTSHPDCWWPLPSIFHKILFSGVSSIWKLLQLESWLEIFKQVIRTFHSFTHFHTQSCYKCVWSSWMWICK